MYYKLYKQYQHPVTFMLYVALQSLTVTVALKYNQCYDSLWCMLSSCLCKHSVFCLPQLQAFVREIFREQCGVSKSWHACAVADDESSRSKRMSSRLSGLHTQTQINKDIVMFGTTPVKFQTLKRVYHIFSRLF